MAHGARGLLLGLGLSAAGVLVGLLVRRAALSRVLRFPLIAIPVCIVAMMLWTAMASPLQSLGLAKLIPYLGFAFLAIFSALAGKLFARLPENKTHQRGTILQESPKLARSLRKPKGLTLAGLPVPESDETKHFKMIGTTGTGQS